MPDATTLIPYLFQPGLKENLSWMTKVMVSNNGYEQKQRLRNSPRQLFSFSITTPRGEIAKLDTLLFGNRGAEFFLPVSTECRTLISDTSASSPNIDVNTEFGDFRVGSKALIYNSPRDFEIVTILSFTTNQIVADANITKIYGTTALVMPVRVGILTGDPKRNTTGDKQRLSATFFVRDNVTLATSPSAIQYKNFDVYLEEPLTIGEFVTDIYTTRMDIVDFSTGVTENFAPHLKTKIRRSFGVQLDTQEDVWNFRLWLHRRAGKYLPFWMPTFENNFTLLSTGALTTQLLVSNDGQDTLSSGRNDLAILTASGWILRGIVDIIPSGNDLLVTLDSSIAIDASAIQLISFLGRKRLTSDKVSIIWDGNNTAHATVGITEINDFVAHTPSFGLGNAFCPTEGLRVTQSVIEVLIKNDSELRATQSVIEVLHNV